jgi:hypothetical protein
MSSVVAEAAIRRVAKKAREQGLGRIATDDATRQSREHPAHRPSSAGAGVLAALAQAGIRLSTDQRRTIDRLLRTHPELGTCHFTPGRAVERLIAHGVHFTDRQLEQVSDETTVGGLRRSESAFDDCRTTASRPAHRPDPADARAPGSGFFGWLRRLVQ